MEKNHANNTFLIREMYFNKYIWKQDHKLFLNELFNKYISKQGDKLIY